MGPKRFVAATAAEALKKIKADLGPDAVVLSNRKVAAGVEIVAIEPEALKAISRPQETKAQTASQPTTKPKQNTPPADPFQENATRVRPLLDTLSEHISVPTTPIQKPAPPTAPAKPVAHPANSSSAKNAPTQGPSSSTLAQQVSPTQNALNMSVMAQLTEVRSMLETHLAGTYWGQMQQHAPNHAEMTKRLLNAGFSPKLSSQLLDGLSANARTEVLLDLVRKRIEERLKTIDPFALFDEGGVYAFIGSTGVGKTTTVAKVAARCVLRYGREQVALLTTDTYRIGAQEQLRVFAKILGLPVIGLRDSDDLNLKLAELSKRRIVLLDTAGVSQRDAMMVEQLKMIGNGCKDVRGVLVLSATTSLRTLDEVVQSHRKAANGQNLFASVITKVDEAATVAPAVDCLLRNELPLLFLSNGQRVPEDLYPPNLTYLAHRTIKPRHHDPENDMNDIEVPALIADSLAAWTRRITA